jgi:hypothetical protein
MKKHIVILAAAVLAIALCGCKEADKRGTTTSGDYTFSRICIDGVEYLQRTGHQHGYMAPHFKPDGTLYLCADPAKAGPER